MITGILFRPLHGTISSAINEDTKVLNCNVTASRGTEYNVRDSISHCWWPLMLCGLPFSRCSLPFSFRGFLFAVSMLNNIEISVVQNKFIHVLHVLLVCEV